MNFNVKVGIFVRIKIQTGGWYRVSTDGTHIGLVIGKTPNNFYKWVYFRGRVWVDQVLKSEIIDTHGC